MSRPDWGALQQEYIAEYTRSGISPVAWCEARGLNYATARRYIKKTPKNAQKEMRKTAQKSARKKTAQTAQRQNGKSQKKKAVSDALLIEGDTEEISFCPDEFGISDQQAKFAMLVAQGKKPTEAYRLAGYERQGATANSNASRMLRNARVYRAISYFRNQYQKRYTADLDLLVSQLMAIVQADPNQLAQFRRVNCRYCWGENHLYQWRDIAEFDKAAAQASRDGKPPAHRQRITANRIPIFLHWITWLPRAMFCRFCTVKCAWGHAWFLRRSARQTKGTVVRLW